METKKRFNTRAFVALMASISGLGLPITGLMNNIYGLESLTFRRHVWKSAHNSLAIIFTISVTWHIVLNRKVLFKYIRATANAQGINREIVYATAIVGSVLIVIVGHVLLLG